MELGLGKLQWAPVTFWSSTLIEIEAAADGLAKFHGSVDEDGGPSVQQPLSTVEFEALKEKLDGRYKTG
jgi:hypothetical protein